MFVNRCLKKRRTTDPVNENEKLHTSNLSCGNCTKEVNPIELGINEFPPQVGQIEIYFYKFVNNYLFYIKHIFLCTECLLETVFSDLRYHISEGVEYEI